MHMRSDAFVCIGSEIDLSLQPFVAILARGIAALLACKEWLDGTGNAG